MALAAAPAAGESVASPALILWVRRVAIVGVLLGAYAFFHLTPNAPSLASIGMLALAAVAQFAPAIIAAVYWPGASRAGVTGGLAAGFVIWMYTLLVPSHRGRRWLAALGHRRAIRP